MKLPTLIFITQDHPQISCGEQIQLACEAGVKWVQLRMKDVEEDVIRKNAVLAREVTLKHNCLLTINDHYKLALEVDADGVHLGQSDTDVRLVRQFAAGKLVIGGTANTIDQMKSMALAGVDYIGLGPYRFTTTKKNLSPVLGVEQTHQNMALFREKFDIPVFAVGGISVSDISDLIRTGVNGVAVSGAITKASNWMQTINEFQNAFMQKD